MISELKIKDLLHENRKLNFISMTCHGSLMVSSSCRSLFFWFLSTIRFKSSQYLISVQLIIKISHKILTFLNSDLSMNSFVDGVIDFNCVFIRHFSLYVHFEEIKYSRFKFCLNEPELLIHLISKDFAKYSNIIVFRRVFLYSRNDVVSRL